MSAIFLAIIRILLKQNTEPLFYGIFVENAFRPLPGDDFKSRPKVEKYLSLTMDIRIALIGLGTVGQGVLELLHRHRDFFAQSLGFRFEIVGVCARRAESLQHALIPATAIRTTDPLSLAQNPSIDVLIEVAGGEDAPRSFVSEALAQGKHVITANKALLAKHGTDLFPLAAKHQRALSFEAAVGGGIPIIRTLEESLIGNEIEGLACIINGTCNYILTEMTQHGLAFEAALSDAQRLGYAEADPTFDIDGWDALHKVSLLASLAYGRFVDYTRLHVEGIRGVNLLDIRMAEELGYSIKLLGVVNQGQDGRISAAVYPSLVAKTHQLAAVNGVLNAVYLKTSGVGPLLLTGAGAGKLPTASSVIADLVALAKQMQTGHAKPPSFAWFSRDNAASLCPIDELETEFYLRLSTLDKPGVLSKVTGILGEDGISIRALTQKPEHDADNVPAFILTHTTQNARIRKALLRVDALEVVTAKTQVLRFWR